MTVGELAMFGREPVRRATLLGFQVGDGDELLSAKEAEALLETLARSAERRAHERLRDGPEAEARIAELRRKHGARAVRVSGKARAKRSRWTKSVVWLVVSYPERQERR